jgi:hypothetical protein
MKSPKAVAFVRQANIANGPQQVNNDGRRPDAHAEIGTSSNELLEDQRDKRMDFGATEAAERAYSYLATLGARDRTAHDCREAALKERAGRPRSRARPLY